MAHRQLFSLSSKAFLAQNFGIEPALITDRFLHFLISSATACATCAAHPARVTGHSIVTSLDATGDIGTHSHQLSTASGLAVTFRCLVWHLPWDLEAVAEARIPAILTGQ